MRAIKMILVLFLALAVSACGQSSATGGGEKSNGSSADGGKPTQSTAANTEKTIKHAMGTATLKKKPERVVVLFNGAVDIVIALGVKPVGAVESWDQKPWYNYLRPQMEGVKNLGDELQPNVEAIMALKPDLIIGQKTRDEKIYPQLNSIAPTIIMEELFDWKENMKITAEALYKEDEAAKFFSDWDKRVAEFKQKVGNKLANTEVSLIRFEKDGSARIYVTGFAGTIFKELGLSRPKAQQVEGKNVVNLTSKEQMSQLDGDFIFDITQSTSDPNHAKSQNDWTSHPLWKGLKGVKNDKYFKVDVVSWNLSGGALAAKALLDDLYKYFDIK
ncbi:iron-siderophore ABC transporter substrate-binding protein [Paenibacillus sp. RC67]|uniref:ABC transporter substrate-binding protein n=1 Tax=Paenibacillus sp. RC67 TaxID=3039392 RepID=UPI0024AD6A08|nr:iron-siderophore ABC transporter substrate-binding protein [Paenibacillus sp. RC67]